MDANGDVFVADYGDRKVEEIPYSDGGYGAPVTIGSGFVAPEGLAVDAFGNVFVADADDAQEIPLSNGTYGTPITVGSGFNNPHDVALDGSGRLYVIDAENIWLLTP